MIQINEKLRAFLLNDLEEIKKHKVRLGILSGITILLIIFLLMDNSAKSNEINTVETVQEVQAKQSKSIQPTKPKKTNLSKAIVGLDEATKDVQLVNPFKSDLPANLSVDSTKTVIPQVVSSPTLSMKRELVSESKLTLKGTAISGEKRMAIIELTTNIKSESEEKKQSTTKMLTIGDEIDGKKIIDINKNFVTFSNGKQIFMAGD